MSASKKKARAIRFFCEARPWLSWSATVALFKETAAVVLVAAIDIELDMAGEGALVAVSMPPIFSFSKSASVLAGLKHRKA